MDVQTSLSTPNFETESNWPPPLQYTKTSENRPMHNFMLQMIPAMLGMHK